MYAAPSHTPAPGRRGAPSYRASPVEWRRHVQSREINLQSTDTCPAREGSERTCHLLSSLSGSLRGSGEEEDSLGLPTILNADLFATPSIPFPQALRFQLEPPLLPRRLFTRLGYYRYSVQDRVGCPQIPPTPHPARDPRSLTLDLVQVLRANLPVAPLPLSSPRWRAPPAGHSGTLRSIEDFP